MYHKRIIVDFDDTLAFTTNRQWNHAKPNKPLIEKLNTLYDEGWIIDIFTARGSISCKTRNEAARKYQYGMEKWLEKHDVKYNLLSFDKPLGAYYIDDKGILPEDFITKNIRNLEGGLSGSDIYTDGSLVHKTDSNAHEVAKWFKTVCQNTVLNVPSIERVVGDTITMEYIEHSEDFFELNLYLALGLIQETLKEMKKLPVEHEYDFNSYIYRIEDHAQLANRPTFDKVVEALHTMNFEPSFSHGDFGIKNMLFSNKELYLIDPIPNMFGCTELDAAKLCASLIINKYDSDIVQLTLETMSIYNNISYDNLCVLTCAEMIRVYKYHPNKNFILECVKNVFK